MQRIVLFFFFLSLGMFSSFNSYAQKTPTKKLHILSTIKPVHLLVKGVIGEYAVSSLLIPENVSTHNYSLRPSDLKKLAKADVVIRISANLERFLNTLFSQSQHVISLSDASHLVWHPVRGSHSHHEDVHEDVSDDENEHESEQEEHELKQDPHLWLDPNNAIQMVKFIAQQISHIDPSHSSEYTENSQQLIREIQLADQQTKETLQHLTNRPYLVFHDGWQYMEHAYGLKQPHVISFHEDLPPGIKTVLSLRQQIKEEGIHCLISSPYSNKKIIHTITDGLAISTVWLSASGSGIPANNHSDFMRYNAEQVFRCLSAQAQPRTNPSRLPH